MKIGIDIRQQNILYLNLFCKRLQKKPTKCFSSESKEIMSDFRRVFGGQKICRFFLTAGLIFGGICCAPNLLSGQINKGNPAKFGSSIPRNRQVKLPAAPANWTLAETSGELVIKTADYEMTIARDGFSYRLRRKNGDTVFETAQANDAAQNLTFNDPSGALKKTAALKDFAREGDRLVLNYATTFQGATARVEVQPLVRAVRVTTHLITEEYGVYPSLRFRLQPSGEWWGGAAQGWRKPHAYPLNEAHLERDGFLSDSTSQGSPVWYATKGVGIWIRTNRDFRYTVNKRVKGAGDGLLGVEMPQTSVLTYDIFVDDNLRNVVRRVVKEIGYPRVVPHRDFFTEPIYTTWVEYKVDVTQAKVLEYARKIRELNLPAGVIELDDKWETAYGDMQFDPVKFPDPKKMVDELHRMNFKVTLWVHPYVNLDSQTYKKYRGTDFLLRDSSNGTGITKWWNGACAVWDLTNPRAAAEFRGKFEALQRKYGFDGFKFDGGDVHRVPQDLRATEPITSAEYADVYNETATAFFPLNETRVGVYSQPTGVVQRLIDKHSVWGMSNGLGSLIPEVIINGLRGWQYVMPDMIGGNEYDKDRIDKELLIRWAQASALMPLIQFSKAPWHYDDETVRISRDVSNLHIRFAPYIYELAQNAPKTGEPILSGLFYYAPDDAETFKIADQFMLGADVVVAPVLQPNARRRDIYLPAGNWIDLTTKKTIKGKQWLKNYPAPLDVLPVFVRVGSRAAKL